MSNLPVDRRINPNSSQDELSVDVLKNSLLVLTRGSRILVVLNSMSSHKLSQRAKNAFHFKQASALLKMATRHTATADKGSGKQDEGDLSQETQSKGESSTAISLLDNPARAGLAITSVVTFTESEQQGVAPSVVVEEPVELVDGKEPEQVELRPKALPKKKADGHTVRKYQSGRKTKNAKYTKGADALNAQLKDMAARVAGARDANRELTVSDGDKSIRPPKLSGGVGGGGGLPPHKDPENLPPSGPDDPLMAFDNDAKVWRQYKQLKAIPWLLLAGAHEYIIDTGRYRYLDGPHKQVYDLPPVDFTDKWFRPKGHQYTAAVYETGQADPMQHQWEMLHYIQEAAEAAIPYAASTKSDLDVRQLVGHVKNALNRRDASWPNADQTILRYLTTPHFADRVVAYEAQRLNVADRLVEAKLYREAASLLATRQQAQTALRIIQESWWRRTLRMFWWENKPALCVSGGVAAASLMSLGMAALHAPAAAVTTVAVTTGIAVSASLAAIDGADEKVMSMVKSFERGTAAVKYASAIRIPPVCSGPCTGPSFQPMDLFDEQMIDEMEQDRFFNTYQYKVSFKRGQQHDACMDKPPYQPYGSIIEGAAITVPKGCHHDIANGFRTRYLWLRDKDQLSSDNFYKLVDVAGRGLRWIKREIKKKRGFWKLFTYEEMLGDLPPARAKMFEEALNDINWERDPSMGAFTKIEGYQGKHPDYEFKPRIIILRTVALMKKTMAALYSFSKFMGKVMSVDSTFWWTSGATPDEVGQIAFEMMSSTGFCAETDASNFDGSLHPFWREFERQLLTWFSDTMCFPSDIVVQFVNHSSYFRSVITAYKGIKVIVNFCRHSGDYITSVMNTVINAVLTREVCRILGADPDDQLKAVGMGDDNFWTIRLLKMGLTEMIPIVKQFYHDVGMKIKMKIVTSLDELEYCSGAFYHTPYGYRWGVKPFRVLAKLGQNLHRHPPKSHKRLLLGTAIGMLGIAQHVPLVGDLLQLIIKSGQHLGLKPIEDKSLRDHWRVWDSQGVDYDVITEMKFLTRYGFTVEDYALMKTTLYAAFDRPDALLLFPVVFHGALWYQGWCVDADYSQIDWEPPLHYDFDERHDIKPIVDSRGLDLSYIPVWEIVVAPFVEEKLKLVWSPFAALIGIYEAWRDKIWWKIPLHVGFYLLSLIHPLLGWAAHAAFNITVWLLTLKYDGSAPTENVLTRRFASIAGGIFIPMHNCLPARVERIMCNFVAQRCNLTLERKNINIGPKQRSKGQKKKAHKNPKPMGKKGSLGRSLLQAAGGAVGSLFGPVGTRAADVGANWLSDVLGMGDYELKENSLMNAQSGVPTFQTSKHSVRIRHREYLGDITGSTGFSNRAYTINPGVETSFPWLSNVAYAFQQYRFHGLLYEFVSTSADALNSVNTALGTVVMSTQYNAANPVFLSKQEMEQYEFSCSSPPSKSLIHPVECDPNETPIPHLYVRTGALAANQDIKMYDLGLFQIATVGMQAAANIGELWITYDVEFFKPRIQPGGAYPGQYTIIANGPYVANANVLGSIQTAPQGNLGITITSTTTGWDTITFPSYITAGRFKIDIGWDGGGSAVIAYNNPVLTNCTLTSVYGLGGLTLFNVPTSGTVFRCMQSFYVTINGYSATGSTILISSAMTLPASPSTVTISVIALPLSGAWV